MPLAALLSAGEEAGRAVVGGSQLPPFVRGKLKPVRLLGHTTSRKWKHVLQPWLHFQDFDSFFFFFPTSTWRWRRYSVLILRDFNLTFRDDQFHFLEKFSLEAIFPHVLKY